MLDLPAEFYLETIDLVFQRFPAGPGPFEWRGRRVDPAAITGPRFSPSRVSETTSAAWARPWPRRICALYSGRGGGITCQPGVGHYGVFSGRAWERRSARSCATSCWPTADAAG